MKLFGTVLGRFEIVHTKGRISLFGTQLAAGAAAGGERSNLTQILTPQLEILTNFDLNLTDFDLHLPYSEGFIRYQSAAKHAA